jgi:hypothetical protein
MQMQAQLKISVISVVSVPLQLSCTLGVNIYFLAALDKSYKGTKCAEDSSQLMVT